MMTSKTDSRRPPCAPTKAEKALEELRAYKERWKENAAQRQAQRQALAAEMEKSIDQERQELRHLVARYWDEEKKAAKAIDECIGILESLASNQALAPQVFDLSHCAHGPGPCPPDKGKEDKWSPSSAKPVAEAKNRGAVTPPAASVSAVPETMEPACSGQPKTRK